MFKNPDTYPVISAILSKFLSLIPDDSEKIELLNQIDEKFKKIPNTGHIKVWLQRVSIKIDRLKEFDEKLCCLVNDPSTNIWNFDWLTDGGIKEVITSQSVVSEEKIAQIDSVISVEIVDTFSSNRYLWK